MIGVVGDVERISHLGTLPGVDQVIRVSSPVQAGEHPGAGRAHAGADRSGRDRPRQRARRHGRAVRRGVARAAARDGPCGEPRGRPHPPRRRMEAAYQPVLVPGPGRPGAEAPGRGARRDRPAGHQRGRRPGRRRGLRRARRHPPGRRAEHAELRAPQGRRPEPARRPPEAGPVRDDRGVAARRRVHPGRRQPERDPLRARDPDLRDRHPQHARPLRRARPALTHAPADRRRSLARHRASQPGRRRWRSPAPRSAPMAS